ncbi:hypothetical protein [Desulfonauticus submarinus]
MKRKYHYRKKGKKERKMTRGYRELSEAIHISLEYSHLLNKILMHEINE